MPGLYRRIMKGEFILLLLSASFVNNIGFGKDKTRPKKKTEDFTVC